MKNKLSHYGATLKQLFQRLGPIYTICWLPAIVGPILYWTNPTNWVNVSWALFPLLFGMTILVYFILAFSWGWIASVLTTNALDVIASNKDNHRKLFIIRTVTVIASFYVVILPTINIFIDGHKGTAVLGILVSWLVMGILDTFLFAAKYQEITASKMLFIDG